MRTKQYFTNQSMDHWRNQEETKKYLERHENWKHDNPKPMECSKSCFKREVYSQTNLPQEIGKISNKQPNLTLKELEKKEKAKYKVSGRKKL